MSSSNSGRRRGSPPLMAITEVPNSPSLSTRWNMLSVGTGLEKSSYSLQYSQANLQSRRGIMCSSKGGAMHQESVAEEDRLLPAAEFPGSPAPPDRSPRHPTS